MPAKVEGGFLHLFAGASPYRVACGFDGRVGDVSGAVERVEVGDGLCVEADGARWAEVVRLVDAGLVVVDLR